MVVGAYDPDGAWTAAALSVTAAGPNRAPVNHVPGEQAVPPPGPVVFSVANGNAITVSDADAGNSPVRVTLAARGGTLTLSGAAGLTFESGGPTGTRQAVFLGTLAAVNAALEGMQFKFDLPTQFGNSLTITTNDLGNTGTGGALGDADTIPIRFSEPPPTVTAVFVSGTRWTRAFLRTLADRGLGDATYGYSIPGGAAQLATLPWANIDRVSIRFSQDVRVRSYDLNLKTGRAGGYGPLTFAYDAATHTATWTSAKPIGADRITLDTLSIAQAITSRDGSMVLDGDWRDGADAFPSGDGVPGEAFTMKLNVLPGDADRNGTVGALDAGGIRRRLGATAAAGSERYSPFYDLDGDGRIGALDFLAYRRRRFTTLPPAPR